MRRLHKSKRVSWAADVNLSQVLLFLSEECPSQVGFVGQDHLRAKPSWLLHSTETGSDDFFLPFGFEGSHPGNELRINLSDIPLIAWSRPYKIVVDTTWVVAAGDESKEVEILNQREMRVLEAVYPHPSAIPPNPSSSVDIENFDENDLQTPLIPVTPVEDEYADTPLDSMEGFSSDEQGSLIDHDLLVKILSSQNMIEKLVRDYGPSASQSNGVGVGHLPNQPLPPPGVVPVSSQPSTGVPPGDMNYYKSLIQQHGGERQEQVGNNRAGGANWVSLNNPKPRIMTPCFFNSVGGCKYGSNCRYQHDETSPKSKAKRRRVEGKEQVGNDRTGGANQESLNNPNPRIMKPCLFFNSVKGCRSGSNCRYQHDETPPKSQAKRRRMEGKDKSLIQQYGGERQEQVGNDRAGGANQESLNSPNPRIMKPCLFFNSAKGCRSGSNCTYQHNEMSPKSKAECRDMEGKDKSFIRQHGGERQEQVGNDWAGGANQESLNNPKPRSMKPCLYFDSDRGCRSGSNCTYQHDETQKVTQRHDETSPKSKANYGRRQQKISISRSSIRPISSDFDASAKHSWDPC